MSCVAGERDMAMFQRGGAAGGVPSGRQAASSGARTPVEDALCCAGCGAGSYRMLHEDGVFWIVCPYCARADLGKPPPMLR